MNIQLVEREIGATMKQDLREWERGSLSLLCLWILSPIRGFPYSRIPEFPRDRNFVPLLQSCWRDKLCEHSWGASPSKSRQREWTSKIGNILIGRHTS